MSDPKRTDFEQAQLEAYRTSWPFSERHPRPDCRHGDGRPVYLAGVCAECYGAGRDKEPLPARAL